VRLERGAVRVPGHVWQGLVPFFHEEVFAFELELGVAAAWRGLRVELAEQVLGGNWEGTKPIGAQEEQYGVREGVQGEVGPVLRGGSRLDPWEG